MCYFFSGIYTRFGELYTLGEEVVHERIIEKYDLRDKNDYFYRWEIVPIEKLGFLKPVDERNWFFRIRSKEIPVWFDKKQEQECWKFFKTWYKTKDGKRFKKKVKAYLNQDNDLTRPIEKIYLEIKEVETK